MNNQETKNLLAIDFGAESGRALLGKLSNGTLELEEIRRFPNEPVQILDTLYWDVPRLFHEIKAAIAEAIQLCESRGSKLHSISVDTWGVDYALLGPTGDLLGNPIHYRDKRLDGIQERVLSEVSEDLIFQETGLQFLSLNTLFQLAAEKEREPDRLERASRLLFMPDLFHYFLTGKLQSEVSIASTSQLWNPKNQSWSEPLLSALEIPQRIMPEVHPPGTVIGPLLSSVYETSDPPLVVAGASHDTGSAIAATPVNAQNEFSETETWAYLSSGTWSLMGLELDAPCIDDNVRREGFTNEGGVAGTIRFLRNLGGLWLVQESRREWERQDQKFDYATLTQLAQAADPLRSIIPPDHSRFYLPGDMPKRVQTYCEETNQPVPQDVGAIVRCELESLALTYRDCASRIQNLTGKRIKTLHILGGGSKNELLNQLTSDALQAEVVAGPTEATAMGNALIQALALGELKSLSEIREVVRNSSETQSYQPNKNQSSAWEAAAQKFAELPRD